MSDRGFTLLEVLVALAVLATVVVVGIEGVGLGATARVRAAEHARLRTQLRSKMAEVRTLSGSQLQRLEGRTEGAFEPPLDSARWSLEVRQVEPGSGLFRVELEIANGAASLDATSYVNRFGELWAQREARER